MGTKVVDAAAVQAIYQRLISGEPAAAGELIEAFSECVKVVAKRAGHFRGEHTIEDAIGEAQLCLVKAVRGLASGEYAPKGGVADYIFVSIQNAVNDELRRPMVGPPPSTQRKKMKRGYVLPVQVPAGMERIPDHRGNRVAALWDTLHVCFESPRDKEIAHTLAEGLTAKEVAQKLGVSAATIARSVKKAKASFDSQNYFCAV